MFGNKLAALAAVGSAALLSSGAALAAVDTTEVVAEIDGAAGPIAAIGAAVLVVLVGIKVYKWIRRAM